MSLSPLLDWYILTVSFFNTISLFWLGLMILLNGNRRSVGTWLTGWGLLLAALFFTSHTAILGRGLDIVGYGMDFWWTASWVPALTAPLAWYGAMLWYAGFRFDQPHRHRPWLLGVLGLFAALVFLLIFANPLPDYTSVAGRFFVATPSIAGVPLLILAYLIYSLACYLLPLDLFLRRSAPREAAAREGSLPNDPRELARPWLVVASLFLLLAGFVLAWTAFWAVRADPSLSLSQPAAAAQVKILDLTVASLVALAITVLGRAIVAYEVFTGRPLPRVGFFRHWRSTVLLAAGYGALAAGAIVIQLRPLYSLMLSTALMTFFYALFSWRNFAEREDFMNRLRPFVASQDLYDQIVHPGSTAGAEGERATTPQALFENLCGDVLDVRSAWLVPGGALATLAGPPLVFNPPDSTVHQAILLTAAALEARFQDPVLRCLAVQDLFPGETVWAVALWNDRRFGGALLLSPKWDRSPFTEEEIEIAQAGGERLLDVLAGVEMARLAMDLLRQRIAQVRVLEGQGRRVLHDEVLPELHTAILYLSGQEQTPEIRQAVETLSRAHRRISNLMRDIPSSVPARLAQGGLVPALQSLLASDFQRDFDGVAWQLEPAAAEAANRMPLFAAEVVFFAARELVRNAARHARGPDHRRLDLLISLASLPHQAGLALAVEDNGVGLKSGFEDRRDRGPAQGNAADSPVPAPVVHSKVQEGNGLRFHSAMLAAVGASLEIGPCPAGGVRAVIRMAAPSPGTR
ncbi:MAG TPA: hypothetical protein VMT46_19690 [Anaerolineaceae bacterium]|nr:hypothetical protein [Anaerolineaceae bacterium]